MAASLKEQSLPPATVNDESTSKPPLPEPVATEDDGYPPSKKVFVIMLAVYFCMFLVALVCILSRKPQRASVGYWFSKIFPGLKITLLDQMVYNVNF
jgi:hypothetical protein